MSGLQFREDELTILNNALNELCNGIHLEAREFETRMGVPREEALALLRKINTQLTSCRKAPRAGRT